MYFVRCHPLVVRRSAAVDVPSRRASLLSCARTRWSPFLLRFFSVSSPFLLRFFSSLLRFFSVSLFVSSLSGTLIAQSRPSPRTPDLSSQVDVFDGEVVVLVVQAHAAVVLAVGPLRHAHRHHHQRLLANLRRCDHPLGIVCVVSKIISRPGHHTLWMQGSPED
jgi:hypothetical protein